ncbi:ArsR/SmtB family transcription factor [Paramicrobacterium chengjingii]|uniref:Winged helix-turn-helix transcriptional regulator n=1 Tax=Paramicrobacterium chengjingii TaxID=2769067 RepID=A0ABX6YHX2_9MICO|nr:metalloregulator ArsR/SmtB family transcription factor [Microbacterium chengjingii]QPZ38399.1 winged helix-turn-helix transcriptional regulator [Microbacterium chengjingii]
MVVQRMSDGDVDRIFQALADATRRDIVERVMAQSLSVSALAGGYAMSFAAVQKHVAVLERAGLVTKQRRGREQLVYGNPDAVKRASALLDEYEAIWRGRIARMHDIVNDDTSGETS